MNDDIIRFIDGEYVINKEGDVTLDSEGRMLCTGCVFKNNTLGCSEAQKHRDPQIRNGKNYSVCIGRKSIWRLSPLEHDKKSKRKLT